MRPLVPAVLFAGLLAAQGQPAGQDACSVEGTVVNSATGQPVPRAAVTLQTIAAPPQRPPAMAAVSSDSEGKFVFTNVAPGSYRITAQRDNFQYVQPRDFKPLVLNVGDQKSGVVVRLTPYGAISGHVQSEEGDALPNVAVSAMFYQYTCEGRQLLSSNGAETNDLGEYRIYSLPAGKYVVRASPGAGPLLQALQGTPEIYIPLYYPSASDLSGAAIVELAAGQDMRGVDFILPRAHGVTVRGHVVKPADAPGASMMVTLDPSNGPPRTGAAADNADGKFELRGVTPGSYTMTARASAPGRNYVAERPLQVGTEDIDGIELIPAPPVDMSGVVHIEGDTTVKVSQIHVWLEAACRGRSPFRDDGDGTFEFRSLEPRVYRPSVEAPGLYLKSVRCGTTDVTESGIDLTGGSRCNLALTLSANGGQIDGQVQDESGNVAPGAWVTLVAQGARRGELFKGVVADANGHFKIAAVAPGSYRLYAWEEVDGTGALRYDPDYIKPFESQGQSVQIAESDKQTVTLKRIPAPQAH